MICTIKTAMGEEVLSPRDAERAMLSAQIYWAPVHWEQAVADVREGHTVQRKLSEASWLVMKPAPKP